MRAEAIRHPFTGPQRDLETYLRGVIAQIDERHRGELAPWVARLVELEGLRKVTHYMVTEPGDDLPQLPRW